MVGIGKAYFYITFSMVSCWSEVGAKGGCVIATFPFIATFLVIARNEAIFTHVMLSEVEASTSGTCTDPSTTLRMTKTTPILTKGRRMSKDCFVVPPRNDV